MGAVHEGQGNPSVTVAFRVIDVSYQQKLLNDRVELRLGRFAQPDDFLVSPRLPSHRIPTFSSYLCISPQAFQRVGCSMPAPGTPFRSALHPVTSAMSCNEHKSGRLVPPEGGVQDCETVVELTYRFGLRKGAYFIQPDFQYIVRPGGTGRLPNAPVFGTQLGINV
jgi:carbohydrate-selective porin OprB